MVWYKNRIRIPSPQQIMRAWKTMQHTQFTPVTFAHICRIMRGYARDGAQTHYPPLLRGLQGVYKYCITIYRREIYGITVLAPDA